MESTLRFALSAFLVLSSAPTTVACGGDDGSPAAGPSGNAGSGGSTSQGASGSGGGTSQSTLTYREYQDKVLLAGCERTLRCDTEGTAKPVEECLATYEKAETKTQVDTFEMGVNEGRISFDADQAEATLAAYPTMACDKGLDLIKMQNEVLTGLVADGGECFAHVECVDVAQTVSGKRLCVDGCDFLTGETGKRGTCQASPISTGACPSK